MTVKITVGDEVHDYPETGNSNYGEEATQTIVDLAQVVAEFFGPGDIRTTETILAGTSGSVAGLVFDVSFVQRIEVNGIITRTFNSSPTKIEAFNISGAYNGSDLVYSVEFSGEETGVTFGNTGGQFTFESEAVSDTAQVTIKYNAKTIIDESVLA